jgi:hypothetical protein
MAQFTVYSSSDAGAGNPGLLFGTAGDLLRVLDLVLVNGYTGKAAAGWTKPFANSGNIGCYRNASPANSGNGFGIVINDNGANVTSTYKEAWITGWESIASVAGPVGTGTGQFPTPAQALTTGHLVARKSADLVTGRAWICFADSLTFYMFVATGDTLGYYHTFWFGDFFSLGGSTDAYRCLIQGNAVENSGAASATNMTADTISTTSVASANGFFASRTSGGGGSSVQLYKMGALCMQAGGTTLPVATIGALQAANGSDNSYYLPPLWLTQFTVNQLRGRIRGLYHSGHATTTWADGQVVTGGGDFAGKTLQAVKLGINGGMWFVETSNTLETN